MSHKFPEYDNLQLSGVNKKVLEQWQEEDLFARTLALREGAPSFVFYEGPPSANGMPGIHHVMARSIKDIFCRYKTMKGFRVDRKAGWDTHGLPVELGVEKALGITKEDIGKKISVDEYNAACRREVMKYTHEWEQLTRLMGYWVDMEHPYITYDNRYIETLWYLLSEIYKKGLLYKGYTIQPYSPAAGTGLSTHELATRSSPTSSSASGRVRSLSARTMSSSCRGCVPMEMPSESSQVTLSPRVMVRGSCISHLPSAQTTTRSLRPAVSLG